MPNATNIIAPILALQIRESGLTVEDTAAITQSVLLLLRDSTIVANAVAALKADGWAETHEGPLGIGTLSDEDLSNIARTVLRSVGSA